MSLFSSIMNKIFHHDAPTAAPAPKAAPAPSSAAPAGTAASTAPAATPSQPVDVEVVLVKIASQHGGGGNWRTSIVDLLKLLDLDSSLNARKELARELNVHAGTDGSAEQNIALHKAVMKKLADNGGKVPDSLKH